MPEKARTNKDFIMSPQDEDGTPSSPASAPWCLKGRETCKGLMVFPGQMSV